MKKIILLTFASLVMASSIPNALHAASQSPATIQPVDTASENMRLVARLHEIESTDKSDLSFREKSELRKETRAIRGSLSDGGNGGVYISVGALIIIILLLIILL